MKFIQINGVIIGIILLIITTILSLLPLPELPEVPGTDKTHHFIAYGSVAFFLTMGRPKKILAYLISVITWSGIIELIQPYVNRYGEWFDLLANTGGVLMGTLLGYTMIYVLSNRKD